MLLGDDFETRFLKTKTFFKKSRTRSAKWTYHKEQGFIINYLILMKFNLSVKYQLQISIFVLSVSA